MAKRYDVNQYDLLDNIYASDAEWVGKYGFPKLGEQQVIPCGEPLPVNYMTSHSDLERTWFHCFIADKCQHKYWYHYNKYVTHFKRAAGIISTDFSLNRDDDVDVQIQNCRKNRVMAYAMHKLNPNTIPTAGFGGEKTWDWCFDSLPHHSTVAITTNTIRNDPEGKRLFIGGMDTLVQTLSPYAIVICGRFPEWIYTKYPGVRIIPIPCYSDLWHRRCA